MIACSRSCAAALRAGAKMKPIPPPDMPPSIQKPQKSAPNSAETNATIYNIALPFKGFSVTKPLPGSPGLIKVKCDAHEWMRAWIWEFDHPYFATTGEDGHFTIKDVPPGTYTLVSWHEAAGEKSTPVTVSAGKTVTADIQLAAK